MRLWPSRQSPRVERLEGFVANGALHHRGHATVVQRRPSPSRPAVNVVLFLLTCVTTLLAGTAFSLPGCAPYMPYRQGGFGSWLCENGKGETAIRKLILHMGNY